MIGEELKSVSHIAYLGVEITNTLNWTTHIQNVVSKSNKLLGFLRRNLHQCPDSIKAQAYKSLVRPNLEYASSAWDPYRQKDIKTCWSRYKEGQPDLLPSAIQGNQAVSPKLSSTYSGNPYSHEERPLDFPYSTREPTT